MLKTKQMAGSKQKNMGIDVNKGLQRIEENWR